MNHFLVDYENVNDLVGLRGAQFFGLEDCLTIFYSNSSPTMRNDIWNMIVHSGCQLKMYKLVNARANALDFYIAAEASALYERGERQIAIITKDKDLSSVVDFIRLKAGTDEVCITKAPSIEEAIISMKDPSNRQRRAALVEASKKRNLDEVYDLYLKEQALKNQIQNLFGESESQETCEKIFQIAELKGNGKLLPLYNHCRHEFGTARGRQFYGMLKTILSA